MLGRPEFNWLLLDTIIAKERMQNQDLLCVQIGANDGLLVDPIVKHVVTGMRTHQVEPHPLHFNELQRLHGHRPNVSLAQVAIGPESKPAKPLYYIDNSFDSGRPAEASGVVSFDRSHVERYVKLFEGKHFMPVVSVDVPVVTYKDMLVDVPDMRMPDILVVDAEGDDTEIVSAGIQVDPMPNLIVFEHEHLMPDEHIAFGGILAVHGYKVVAEKNNTLAYNADRWTGIPKELSRTAMPIYDLYETKGVL